MEIDWKNSDADSTRTKRVRKNVENSNFLFFTIFTFSRFLNVVGNDRLIMFNNFSSVNWLLII